MAAHKAIPSPSEIDIDSIRLHLTDPNKEGKRDLKIFCGAKPEGININVKCDAGFPMYISSYDANPASANPDEKFDHRRISFGLDVEGEPSILCDILVHIDEILEELEIKNEIKYFEDVQARNAKTVKVPKYNSFIRFTDDGVDETGKKIMRPTGFRKNIKFDGNNPSKDTSTIAIYITESEANAEGKRKLLKGYGFPASKGGSTLTLTEFKDLVGSYICTNLVLNIPFVVRTPGVQYGAYIGIRTIVCYKTSGGGQAYEPDGISFDGVSTDTTPAGITTAEDVKIASYGAEPDAEY